MRIIFLIVLVLGAIFAWLWHSAKQSPELSQKQDISLLQGVVMKHLGKDLGEPIIFEKKNGTCSVGILTEDRQSRAWILLYSSTTKHAYRSVPKPYLVTQKQMDEIKRECKISQEAKKELQTHLSHASL